MPPPDHSVTPPSYRSEITPMAKKIPITGDELILADVSSAVKRPEPRVIGSHCCREPSTRCPGADPALKKMGRARLWQIRDIRPERGPSTLSCKRSVLPEAARPSYCYSQTIGFRSSLCAQVFARIFHDI
jgi:hypothetical protein